MGKVKLLIGADIVPTTSNEKLFINGEIENLIGKELQNVFAQADYRILNLETPLADKRNPIDKAGPNLIAATGTIETIKKMNINLFTLANNHIMDQGVQGFESTIKVLHDNNIEYVGVGRNLEEATKPFVIDKNDIKIGIYACAEHEFSICESDKPGANPFDALYSLDHIQELKSKSDYVIVLYHGMKELYRLPTPRIQKTLRRMIDKGADLVICQHSHCIGCEEDYNNGKIIYGQGNFLFDHGDNEFWNSSLLLVINITQEKLELEYIPVVKNGNVIRKANKNEADLLMDSYWERSRYASDEVYIQKKYSELAQNLLPERLRAVSGWFGTNIFFRVLNKLSRKKLMLKFYSKEQLLRLRNQIECEVHQEILIQGINDRIKEM